MILHRVEKPLDRAFLEVSLLEPVAGLRYQFGSPARNEEAPGLRDQRDASPLACQAATRTAACLSFSTTADVVYGVRSTAGSQALNPLSLPGSREAERHRHLHLWQTGGFTVGHQGQEYPKCRGRPSTQKRQEQSHWVNTRNVASDQ